MANGITTNLSVEDSIELFLKHYKYGKNYEDSTILIDPSYNIIWFFDRGTSNIDSVQSELPFNWWFIIKNWEPIEINELIKYEPYDYEMAINKYSDLINKTKKEWTKEEVKALYEKIKQEVADYNINYFNFLLMENETRND